MQLAPISLFIAAQGYMLFLLLLVIPRGRPLANGLLAMFIFLQATKLFIFYFYDSGVEAPKLVYVFLMVPFLLGPLLYCYVRALIFSGFRLQYRHSIHLLPFLIAGLLSFWPPFLFFRELLPWLDNLLPFLYYTSFVIYLVASMRLLGHHEQLIQNSYSSLDRVTLNWLHKLLLLALIANLGVVVCKLCTIFFDIEIEVGRIAEYISDIVVFYVIAIEGYRKQGMRIIPVDERLSPVPVDDNPAIEVSLETSSISEPSGEEVKYRKSSLGTEQCEMIWRKLNDYMLAEEPFLDSELRMPDLAADMRILPNDLSQAINTVSGKNFYGFINAYRAEKARQLIEEDATRKMAMIDIAMDAGFSSKATFYKHFKKCFAKTPYQYKKSLADFSLHQNK